MAAARSAHNESNGTWGTTKIEIGKCRHHFLAIRMSGTGQGFEDGNEILPHFSIDGQKVFTLVQDVKI